MRLSKLGIIGAVVMLGSCATIGAFAQDAAGQPPAVRPGGGQGRGGFGQGRFGGGGISLVNVPVDLLAKELKLSDEQKTTISAAQMKFTTDQRALFQPPADGSQPDRQAMMAKMQELNQAATKDIQAALKDDQKTDAVALIKSLQTLQRLRVPYQTYSDLKLTSEQKTKLTALAADVAKDMAAKQQEFTAARDAGDQAKMQELMAAMRPTGQPDAKTLAVLTAEQKELIEKYVKDHPQGRRPGGPGGFGPGANRAPQP